MLRIRLTRTGKKKQPSFRLVVAEHTKAVKRQYLELLGQYIPAVTPKQFTIKRERIEYWLSKGAQPSDTVATLLKKEGFADMDKYIGNRELQRKKKKEVAEEKPAEGDAPKVDAPKEEAKADTPKEEAPKEEAKADEPKEETPKEEAPKEE